MWVTFAPFGRFLQVGFDKDFVAVEFCDCSDGVLGGKWVVAVSDVREPLVSSSFDFGRGIGFVWGSASEWVCVVRFDFDQDVTRNDVWIVP